jgi:hypothetical protein
MFILANTPPGPSSPVLRFPPMLTTIEPAPRPRSLAPNRSEICLCPGPEEPLPPPRSQDILSPRPPPPAAGLEDVGFGLLVERKSSQSPLLPPDPPGPAEDGGADTKVMSEFQERRKWVQHLPELEVPDGPADALALPP